MRPTPTRSSPRRRCRRHPTGPWTRWPSGTTWRCRWAILLYGSAEKALLSDTTTGGYAGTEDVGGARTVHLAFKDTGVDWEVWLPAQGEPLPKRLKVVQTKRTGQPVIDLTFTAWDLAPKLEDAAFVPKVPAEYEGIAILQRAAAVKRAAEAAVPDPAAPANKK